MGCNGPMHGWSFLILHLYPTKPSFSRWFITINLELKGLFRHQGDTKGPAAKDASSQFHMIWGGLDPTTYEILQVGSEGFWGSGNRNGMMPAFQDPVFRHGFSPWKQWFFPQGKWELPTFSIATPLISWFSWRWGWRWWRQKVPPPSSLVLSLAACRCDFWPLWLRRWWWQARISKAWWLGQAFDGRPLTFCLFHDVRDVTGSYCVCPKLGTPKSTMLVYFIFFHNKHDNLWVLSIFCTAPSITSSVSHALASRWVWPAVSASPSSRWSVSWKKVDGQIEGVGGSIRCWVGRQDIQKKRSLVA